MKPLISLIIPTYNRPRMLAECLKAIAMDPYKNIEVIVVNDAGTDPTPVIASFQDQLHLVLLNQPHNRGHVAARNRGLEIANGEYIMLCDDDDILLPGHITRMVQAFRPEDTLLFSDVEIVTYTHEQGHRQPKNRYVFAFDFDDQLLRKWNIIISSGMLYKKSIHDELGYFDEEMRDYWDWDFFLRLSAIAPLRRIPYADVLYLVSSTGGNLSSNTTAMQKSLQRFQDKHHLGILPVSSFLAMTQEPSLLSFRRPSCVLWDGTWNFLF